VIGYMQVSSKDGALRVRKCLRPTQQTAAKLEVRRAETWEKR